MYLLKKKTTVIISCKRKTTDFLKCLQVNQFVS